jgi:hypothetical protein
MYEVKAGLFAGSESISHFSVDSCCNYFLRDKKPTASHKTKESDNYCGILDGSK